MQEILDSAVRRRERASERPLSILVEMSDRQIGSDEQYLSGARLRRQDYIFLSFDERRGRFDVHVREKGTCLVERHSKDLLPC
jgi:hypothetical protein